MNIIQDFIPAGRANRPGKQLIGPIYITIHETGNASAGADALAHARYLKGDSAASRSASWHFTVDDTNVVQHLPLSEVAWHAGDGNGPGNTSSISIEICENADGDRAKAEERAVELVAFLLKTYKLGIEAVVQHNRWSGKNCPRIIRSRPGGWESFLQKVRNKMSHDTNKPVENPVDKSGAEKVIGLLGALWTASDDKSVQAAAHYAANALRDGAGIPRP
ncbi:MAG TPA: N-acetylmuramoyl-L-alanine amidase [Brevibacillus sp.]|nr:N-acetylmuramoyl-L-alanine amidase [Brevibacillus sp.]